MYSEEVTLNKSTTTVVNDILDDKTKHYIAKSTFAVSFNLYLDSLGSSGNQILLDSQYFEVSLHNYRLQRYPDGSYNTTSNLIPLAKWNDTFPLENKNLYERLNIKNSVWPTSDDYFLMGDFNSDETYYLTFDFRRWQNTTENNNHWKSNEEIDALYDRNNFL